MALLEVNNLRTYFHTRNGIVKAVDGISFMVDKGETLGIVGESGSGKSVSCYSMLGLIPCPPGRIEEGSSAVFDGTDLLKCSQEELRQIRGKRVAMIFQDPRTCLNPFLKVGEQLIEPLMVHYPDMAVDEARKKAIKGLKEVGILDAEQRMKQYPHELSGGMRQRVMIAMALITEPELLIADEPTTALDVTVQAQILDVIDRMQKSHGTAVIFITHDLGVVAGISDRVLVMYAGRIAERGTAEEVFYRSRHPYTRALMKSIPAFHTEQEELYTIPGLPPDVSKSIPGCAFATRCEFAEDACKQARPDMTALSETHKSTCRRVNEEIFA